MVQLDYCQLDESYSGATGNFYLDGAPSDGWLQLAELPLKTSKWPAGGDLAASVELRGRCIPARVVWVNSASLIVNLVLAVVAAYLALAATDGSPSTAAFAADCALDLISSAILLWRYCGDLDSVYLHAREQIACIYLGALFEVSAIGILVKTVGDLSTGGASNADAEQSAEMFLLALAASVACCVLTAFKVSLYQTLRDKSILLDVVNTIISTVFAVLIVISQALIRLNRSFWFLDPVLSILLALIMVIVGLKVIQQNFNILKPSSVHLHPSTSHSSLLSFNNTNIVADKTSGLSKGSNYASSQRQPPINRTDYSTIAFY